MAAIFSATGPDGRHFTLNLRFGLADHHGLRLSHSIGEQLLMVLVKSRVWLDARYDIRRMDGRALVKQLIKGVLTIGSCFSPDDRA